MHHLDGAAALWRKLRVRARSAPWPAWPAGVAWVAWLAGAVLVFSGGRAGAEQMSLRTFGQADGLANQVVTAIVQDGGGYLWAGTENGLFRFDGARFQRYGKRDGLPQASITTLATDAAGRLWVGTEAGLCQWAQDRCVAVPDPDGKPMSIWSGQRFARLGADAMPGCAARITCARCRRAPPARSRIRRRASSRRPCAAIFRWRRTATARWSRTTTTACCAVRPARSARPGTGANTAPARD